MVSLNLTKNVIHCYLFFSFTHRLPTCCERFNNLGMLFWLRRPPVLRMNQHWLWCNLFSNKFYPFFLLCLAAPKPDFWFLHNGISFCKFLYCHLPPPPLHCCMMLPCPLPFDAPPPAQPFWKDSTSLELQAVQNSCLVKLSRKLDGAEPC